MIRELDAWKKPKFDPAVDVMEVNTIFNVQEPDQITRGEDTKKAGAAV